MHAPIHTLTCTQKAFILWYKRNTLCSLQHWVAFWSTISKDYEPTMVRNIH